MVMAMAMALSLKESLYDDYEFTCFESLREREREWVEWKRIG
jgi:hypothetical protein